MRWRGRGERVGREEVRRHMTKRETWGEGREKEREGERDREREGGGGGERNLCGSVHVHGEMPPS